MILITIHVLNILRRLILMTNMYLSDCAGHSPVPLTPDYGGLLVHYADGIFDPHFNRYLTVMEGG